MSVARGMLSGLIAGALTAACTSVPSEIDSGEGAAPVGARPAPHVVTEGGVLELLKQPRIEVVEDRSLSTTWSVDAAQPKLYRFISQPVSVGGNAEARFEFYLPMDRVFEIAGRGVVVRPSEIERYILRTGTAGYATASTAEEVAAFVTRPDLATFCGTRTLMFEGTLQLGGAAVRAAVGAIHLLPRAGVALRGHDCPFLTVGWEGWNPLPGLLCKRQDCTFRLGPWLGNRVLYTGKCTPTPMALQICSCSPI